VVDVVLVEVEVVDVVVDVPLIVVVVLVEVVDVVILTTVVVVLVEVVDVEDVVLVDVVVVPPRTHAPSEQAYPSAQVSTVSVVLRASSQ